MYIIALLFTVIFAHIDCTDMTSNCYNGPHYTKLGSVVSCAVPGVVAMTFDDGPSKYTMFIAKKLYDHDMRATFFTVGKRLNYSRYILRYLVTHNHQIACHSYSHEDFTMMTTKNMLYDITTYENKFASLSIFGTTVVPKYIRMPFSRINEKSAKLLKEIGYTVVDFTLDGNDTISNNILGAYQSYLGDPPSNIDMLALSVITIQHDTTESTYKSIEKVIQWFYENFAANGTQFVTIAECLNDQNPYKQLYIPIDSTNALNSHSVYLYILFSLIMMNFNLEIKLKNEGVWIK